MHQALGFGQFGKGLGKATFTTIEPGNHAVADQHTDIPARSRFHQPRLQAGAARARLQTHAQQIPFVQGQPRPHRVQPLRRQPLQALQALADDIKGAQHFATSMQDAGTVVTGQGLEQGVVDALCQFQGFAVPVTCSPEVSVDNGQVR
ncbi:hypothetical protein D9M73_155830 [compost metagenome]